MGKTAIEWTEMTWNPVTGCDKVSPGCDHCYAETIANRFAGSKPFPNGFAVTLHPDRLEQPLRWRKPRRIFVNSMSDLFHDSVPNDYIAKIWETMSRCPQHTFQILTKRPGRMRSLLNSTTINRPPLPNIWLGISAEDQRWADIRIPILLDTPAAIRFISAEPLLGPIDLLGDIENPGPAIIRTAVHQPGGPWGPDEYDYDDQIGIDWVIVGGESGRGARPMHPDWARSLADQCDRAGIAFLFKQWGGRTPKAGGRLLDGVTRDGYPAAPPTPHRIAL